MKLTFEIFYQVLQIKVCALRSKVEFIIYLPEIFYVRATLYYSNKHFYKLTV